MPAYAIAEHIITDATKFEEYRTKVGPMIAEHGGTLLARLREASTVWMLGRPEGCWGDAVGAADAAG